MTRLLPLCFLSLILPMVASARPDAPKPLGPLVEKGASQLQWLSPEAALYDTRPWGPGAQHVADVLARLNGEWTRAQVLPLLHSPNPRVRTLGIVLLFRLDRVDVLPDIAAMADDGAPTFPRPANLANAVPPGSWPMEKLNEMENSRSIDEFQRDTKFKPLAGWHARLTETVGEWSP